mmetsp:Transcript_67389/g.125853  ORF Transcript_67389/g.125853 Transcript_67389/m.125853 type:complete len:233 (+) Transcript_67389:65-763(+)
MEEEVCVPACRVMATDHAFREATEQAVQKIDEQIAGLSLRWQSHFVEALSPAWDSLRKRSSEECSVTERIAALDRVCKQAKVASTAHVRPVPSQPVSHQPAMHRALQSIEHSTACSATQRVPGLHVQKNEDTCSEAFMAGFGLPSALLGMAHPHRQSAEVTAPHAVNPLGGLFSKASSPQRPIAATGATAKWAAPTPSVVSSVPCYESWPHLPAIQNPHAGNSSCSRQWSCQ